MYRFIFITIIFLASVSCQMQQAQTANNSVKDEIPSMSNSLVNSQNEQMDENENEFVETFSDDKNIGVRGKNKIELSEHRKSEAENIELKFYSLGKNKNWELKQNIKLEKHGGGSCDMQIKDFNNDGFKDVTFISGEAARGANEIRTLFIYDTKSGNLIRIKNSEEYPNISYNKKLNCISAWRFYGGNATDFARIEGDTLKTFAYVETFGTERNVYLLDKHGNKKLLRTDEVSKDDEFAFYETFNPPKAYSEKETEQ